MALVTIPYKQKKLWYLMHVYKYQKINILKTPYVHPNLHINKYNLDCFKNMLILLHPLLLVLQSYFFCYHCFLKILCLILVIIFYDN